MFTHTHVRRHHRYYDSELVLGEKALKKSEVTQAPNSRRLSSLKKNNGLGPALALVQVQMKYLLLLMMLMMMTRILCQERPFHS